MDWLHVHVWFVDAVWFRRLLAMVILLNPFALLPQTVAVFTAPNVDAISLFAFYIFAGIQVAFCFEAIRTKNLAVFLAMVLSFVQSCTIIVTVLVRRA